MEIRDGISIGLDNTTLVRMNTISITMVFPLIDKVKTTLTPPHS